MNTQLMILSSGTIFASSGIIDLYNDIPISLNYNIADIKTPQNRNADYSKTITVPGSNNNNNLLSHIYEIGIDRLYNPNHKVEARILYDSVQVFKGFMRLAKIMSKDGGLIEYDLELRGRLDDLFVSVKGKFLTDLTWSDLDHTYNKTNLKASWSTPVGSNYVYPVIDYGYSINKKDYEVSNFAPATYLKEIWDRIFSYAGFQYSSTFLTGTFFKSLIIPFTSDKMRLTEAQINLRQFRASRATTDQTFAMTFGSTYTYTDIIFNNDSTAPNEDTGGVYNTTTGIWTCGANGYYNISAYLTIAGDAAATQNSSMWCRIIDVTNTPRQIDMPGSYYAISTQTISFSIATPSPLYISSGTQVKVQLAHLTQSSPAPNISVKIGSYVYVKAKADMSNGDTIIFENTIPQKLTITELLINVIKMFNLYFEYDKDIPNKIYIEPRNDYYNSTIQDWSEKLDTNSIPEIIPMGSLDAKRYIFKYKKDNDYLNSIYQDTYGKDTNSTYGDKLKEVDNDFLKNDNVMESIFSPTPLYSDTTSNRVYPLIEKVDPVTKVISQIQANPRILYYGGLKTSTPSWNLFDFGKSNPSTETQYPYCGHLDDPDAPTLDLSFGVPNEVYYIPVWNASYSNNNIYNKYWRQFIEEITDKNSSIVVAWFWLKPVDIMEVDFRHVYRFLNQNFRLNKIYDYNPSENSLTKCEFIKIKGGIPFVAKTKTFTGARDSIFDPQIIPLT